MLTHVIRCRGVICGFLVLLFGALECPGQKWLVGTSPNFQVLSGSSERETRRLLLELERFRANVLGVFPIGEAREPRLRVYLFPSRKSFRPYAPHFNGKPRNDVSGYFIGAPDEAVIALLPRSEADAGQDPIETIHHEYFHLLTHARGLNLPLWLEEGLAEVFSTLRIVGQYAEIGAPKQLYAYVLSEYSMLPIEELIAVDKSSPHYNEELRGGLFYAQAWAFVHYLFCGTEGGNYEKLAAYIEGLREPDVDAGRLFRRIFGHDLRSYDFALRQYFDGGRYRIRRIPAKAVDEGAIEVRPASEFERDVELANLEFRIRDDVDLTERVLQLRSRDPNSPRPYEVLAAIASKDGEHATAREYWAAGAERGSDNPYLYVAMTRDRMGGFDLAEFERQLSPEDAFDVQRWVDRALALRPGYAEAVELLAEVEARSPSIRVHAVNRLQSMAGNLPRRDRTLLALAVIRSRAGDADTSRLIVESLLQSSETRVEVRHAARMLRYRLDGDTVLEPVSTGRVRAGSLRETTETLKQGGPGIGEPPIFGKEYLPPDVLNPAR